MRFFKLLLMLMMSIFVFSFGMDAAVSGLWSMGAHPVLEHAVIFDVPREGIYQTWSDRLFWLGIALLPVAYFFAWAALMQKRPGAIEVLTRDGATTLLEPTALNKFAESRIRSHPAVVREKVRVWGSGRHGMSVGARVLVRPIQSLPEIRASLERSIRDGFGQVLGIEKIDEVKIVLGLDVHALNEQPGSQAEPDPAPEPPIRAALEPAEIAEPIAFAPSPEMSPNPGAGTIEFSDGEAEIRPLGETTAAVRAERD